MKHLLTRGIFKYKRNFKLTVIEEIKNVYPIEQEHHIYIYYTYIYYTGLDKGIGRVIIIHAPSPGKDLNIATNLPDLVHQVNKLNKQKYNGLLHHRTRRADL